MTTRFHNKHFHRLAWSALLLACIQVFGTLVYHGIGAPTATWIDSFYMTFITIATIGYGEVVDLSHHPWGRMFTVFLAVIGIGTVTYLSSNLVAFLVDSNVNAELKRKRMEKKMAQYQGHYIVCGVGRVGSNVCHELHKTQRQFVVIDTDKAALDNWLEHHPHPALYLQDDAADDDALRLAGVSRAAGVFAVTDDDSHNLMIALSVKLINPKARVVVRLHDIRNAKKARKAGADEIVSPDFTGGMRIASAMVRPHVVNFMDQMLHRDDGLRVEEVMVPPGFASVAVAALVPKSPDYLLMATHEAGHWIFNPADDHMVTAGVVLVLMANPAGRAQVEKRLAASALVSG